MRNATSKRTKPGFASEVAFHPDITVQTTMEEFKAATIQKARESGTSEADIAAIKFYPDIEIDPITREVVSSPLQELGFPYVRFGRQANEPRFFAVYRDPFDGQVFQIRTSWQRWDTRKGKYGKPYLFQTGSNPLYTNIPADQVEPRYHIWTEGKNKADFGAANGYGTSSLTGINGGYRVKDGAGSIVPAYLNPRVLERFQAIDPDKDKLHVLTFDQDEKQETRNKVSKALATFARLLEAEGYKVLVAEWDALDGKGLDDVGMAVPADRRAAWLKLVIEGAMTYEQWRKRNYRSLLLQKGLWLNSNCIMPERTTTTRYIPELPALTPGVIHGVQSSGTGDGKTTTIGAWVAANRAAGGFTLVLYHANSVGKLTANDWDLPHIHDYHSSQDDLLWADADQRSGAILCLDSGHRVPKELLEKCNLLIFDEANQGIAHLCEGGTLKSRQSEIMGITADLMRDVIARGGSIVLSEVTLYQRTIEYVKTLSECDKLRFFNHERSDFESWDISLITGTTSGFYYQALGVLESGKKLIFPIASQQQGEKLHRLVSRHLPDKTVVRIDSKTNDLGEFDAFWSDPNLWLRSNGIPDLLIYSPSGKSGVSITEPGFDEVWGHFTTHTPDCWMQMIGRYRLPVPRKIFIVPIVQSYSGDERICSVRGVQRRLESSKKGFAKMHGIDLAEKLAAAKEQGKDPDRLLKIEQAVINFLAAERTSVGCQKATAKDYFISILQSQGHTVTEMKVLGDKAIGDELKKIQEELWRELADIASDIQDGGEDANGNRIVLMCARLKAIYAKVVEVYNSNGDCKEVEKLPSWIKNLLDKKLDWRIEFPGIDFNSLEDCYQFVVKDYGTMRRGVLLQSGAENLKALQSLEYEQVKAILSREIALPHSLPKLAMSAKLIELCGVLALLDGSTYHNEDERAIIVHAAALEWKKEILSWLGLTIKDSQTPVEVCNKLLLKLGLDAEAVSRPGSSGNRDRIYQVPGLVDPYRNRLLDAARRRLDEAAAEQQAESSPSYDEASVIDALAMLRDAGDDPEMLKVLWESFETLPGCDREEIWARLDEHERAAITAEQEVAAW